jgi:hypothetical protein
MSRYIDADELKGALQHYKNTEDSLYYDELEMYIDDTPTADVEEVRHGRWKEWNYPNEEYVECSACFTRYYQDDLLMGNEDYPLYCPGCGAKMDKEEEE